MTIFVICVGSSLLSKAPDVTLAQYSYDVRMTNLSTLTACSDIYAYNL